MDESRICRLGVKADRLCDSQSNDTLQHQDSNCAGASSRHSLQEDEDSNFIRKNRNLVNPVYCTQESRMEPPGPDGGRDPSDDQQDAQCNRNKGKTLGKEVLLLMQALNTLSTPEEKLAALCKTYADLNRLPLGIKLLQLFLPDFDINLQLSCFLVIFKRPWEGVWPTVSQQGNRLSHEDQVHSDLTLCSWRFTLPSRGPPEMIRPDS
ncbi:gamma-taxilin-like isoform X1 [Panthera leo]|uniref:gamma-taxilin-like isoform X1 n=1 Tax=Panthera leo TaxID=9689 RepID=UPI001C699368|nr:gamma-taxilin-like isoform X1 [Panthera leo]XP_042782811.1 gamma-taxilin-like isoform X1 [Panthera leo]